MLITENQLDEWVRGNARDAQGLIVELVWRLVAASCPKPRERRFPLGDSIGQHGPDGILDVTLSFDPFVPEGRSYWEIGTGLNAEGKATSDYRGLTETVPKNMRGETTFIFVTPLSGRRDWEYTWKEDAQATWLERHRSRGEWKDVQIIDGTRLIDWIHQFPAVELWIVQKTSLLMAEHIETPEQHWSVIKSIGEPPPLVPDLFLQNRFDASEKLKNIFDGVSLQLKLSTHHPNQVVDYISAYFASLDNESRAEVAGKCLIVSTVDAWNRLCTQYRNLVLIADTALDLSGDVGTTLIQKARRNGHAIIFGGAHGGIPDPASVALTVPRIHQIQESLEKAGYNEERARTLAQKSGGNLGSLLRCIQNLSLMPEWAERTEAAELALVMVLGSWNEKLQADLSIVEEFVGKEYGEWINMIREIALHPATPLNQRDGNWKFVPRYEGWYALGFRLFDQHLDKLKILALSVLREKDPQFELPTGERYMANVHGKVLSHSRELRNGLAETLALLGSHPKALSSCSIGKPEATATLAVREILLEADWVLWGSLDNLLPLLAEASPREFLSAVELALRSDPCPFDELFAQEASGITGRTYLSGLLWALETLAWDADYLNRVAICLGELATHDPGGQWSNRPPNTLSTIFLPWLPQTCAPIPKRVTTVRTLLEEFPDVGWKLLISLLPEQHSVSSRTRKPAWRETIPDDWHDGATNYEYWEQISAYAELALNEATKDVDKLIEFTDHIRELPQPIREQLLDYLSSDHVLQLPEPDRLRIWNHLVNLATKHRRYSDAEWAMGTAQVEKIETVAKRLALTHPFYNHQRLFNEHDFSLYEEKGNYETQRNELAQRRLQAIQEVRDSGGIQSVIEFAQTVQSSWRVGFAFGTIEIFGEDEIILPSLLLSEDRALVQFSGGYVLGRHHTYGWEWVDNITISNWTPEQVGQFLAFLPFTMETWERVTHLLGNEQLAYWSKTSANPYETTAGLEFAVEKLVIYGRPNAAIGCLNKMIHDKQPIDSQLAIRALLDAIKSTESLHSMDGYEIVELIKILQKSPEINLNELSRIEWAYLPLLDRGHEARPKLLWKQLAEAPEFFCEVIRVVFRSKKEERYSEEADEIPEERKRIATNAYRLLREWKFPPGLQDDGGFNPEGLTTWLDKVKNECKETGHLEVAMTMVGHVLVYTPPDPDGLWIHRSAALVLNAKDAHDLRSGFETELFNSRGVRWVDPTGKPERELAGGYRAKAEIIENAGYYRLANTLRELADTYNRLAENVLLRDPYEDY